MRAEQEIEQEATAEFWQAEAEREAERAAESLRSAEESFERCNTDGFLSQYCSGLSARLHEARAEIARNGGQDQFVALFTLPGERVRARVIHISTALTMAGE